MSQLTGVHADYQHESFDYAATLAKWIGITPANMATVFPNLSRFATADLGFML